MRRPASFETVFGAALRGGSGRVVGSAGRPVALPVPVWAGTATAEDRIVLQYCVGATLDVGCGPGRMTEALAADGRPALGIDLVAQAVRLTRARGVAAIQRDVFDRVPGEGRWTSALLADGNIGIGGDPRRLLSRVAGLVRPGGRVVVDLAPPGTGIRTDRLRLVADGRHSPPFPWTVVGADDFARLLAGTGLVLAGLYRTGDRSFGVAERGPR